MSERATLLVELLTEELPPKELRRLSDAFADAIHAGLAARDLLSAGSRKSVFATPRRLGVTITDVARQSPQKSFRQKVLPASVAIDASGAPTPALAKKLSQLGLADASSLVRENDGNADVLFHQGTAAGVPIAAALQAALDQAIARLPIPKMMAYASAGGYYNDVRFVRPARRLVALHGSDVLPVQVLHLDAGRITGGHRFASRGDLDIPTADAYAPLLEAEGKVMPSFATRRDTIVSGLRGAASGAEVLMPDALLDEVTALVEWPVVYAGTFDAAFLDVPHECLILTMQQNQKYFALADGSGRLVNRFLLVSNIAASHPDAIVRGNERVLRARLADAKFFYDHDRQTPLATRVGKLDKVVYHHKLGSQVQRIERLRKIARRIAPIIGADATLADRAALLAKADLVTDMVGEFPELQGTMGRYYALNDGEPAEVADAIAQHYAPRFAGDALPQSPVAQAVALADKLETLAGMFGIGQVPTGDKDPFGMRRAALGVIRILIEKRIATPIATLIDTAFASFEGIAGFSDASSDVLAFLNERLRGYLRDLGYSANEVSAVVAGAPSEYYLIPEQLAAIRVFETLPEALALAAANKRIVNILKKSDIAVVCGQIAPMGINPVLLTPGAEANLAALFTTLREVVENKCAAADWTGALLALAGSRGAVDAFFDEVMVMADDPDLRANRLQLLRSVAATMNRVADIGKLAQ